MSCRRATALAIAAALMAVGSFLHHLPESGSYASLSDSELSMGNRFIASFSPTHACALWANATDGDGGLRLGGSRNVIHGCIQSNRDMVLRGAQNHFNGSVRYVSSLSTNDAQHTFARDPIQVSPGPFPVTFDLLRYAPGGAAALAAAQANKYYLHVGSVTLTKGLLREGLHFVDGNAVVDASGIDVPATVVATGKVHVKASDVSLRPYTDGLLFYAGASGRNVILMEGDTSTFTGVAYAPAGHLHVSTRAATYTGQLLAHALSVTGDGNGFTGRSAAIPAGDAALGGQATAARYVGPEPPQAGDVPVPSPRPPQPPTAEDLQQPPALGASVGDFDGDGWSDLVVAITLTPDQTYLARVSPRGVHLEGATHDPWEVLVP